GLVSIERVLRGIDGVAFAHLDAGDVVRHELVGRIVAAYERYDEARAAKDAARGKRKDARDER
ncbi:MAG: PhoH family protein, partial [Bifidobacterium castoris]|nr:PhoH family protein [Bifidobacterium castoris]